MANQYIDKISPLVADPSTIFRLIKPEHKWFTVIDLANGFWSVPIAKEIQSWFAFTIQGQQYTFTRLPQGLHNSPTIYQQSLQRHLKDFDSTSVVIQYIDDVLINEN